MKKHIILLSLALMAVQVYAQHDEQVKVEGKYRPKVNKVDKLLLKPETPQPSYTFPDTEVIPKDAKQKFDLDLEKLSPTAFASKNDKLVTPAENFLMAGLGTRVSPIFLYKHNSMLTKNLGLGVGINHRSSWLNIKNYAPSGYMNNAFDVNLSSSQFDGMQLTGGVYYKNDMYHYYGVDTTLIPLSDAQIDTVCPRQTYNTIGVYVGLTPTSNKLEDLIHEAKLNYRYTFSRFDAKEHFLGLDYLLGYTRNFWGNKSHPQKVGLDLGLQYDYIMGMPELVSVYDRIFVKFNPFIEMKDEFYRLHLGVRVDGATRMTEKEKFFAFRPDLSGSIFVMDKKLEFYAGLNGGREMLSYNGMIEKNPFVGLLRNLRFQNVKMGFDGGVRTNILETIDLHLGVRYRHTDNDPFFVAMTDVYENTIVFNRFNIEYDETQTVSVLADARVKLRNSLVADLNFAYNKCTPTHYDHAYYRPTTEGKLKLTYDFNESLSFNMSCLYQGGRWARLNSLSQSFKLMDVFDLAIGADYKVNDQITAFALFDNVANQKYHLYYYYPVTGIQFFAGVKMVF